MQVFPEVSIHMRDSRSGDAERANHHRSFAIYDSGLARFLNSEILLVRTNHSVPLFTLRSPVIYVGEHRCRFSTG